MVLLFWLPLVLVCVKAPINLLLHLATFMKPTDSVFATANGILNSVFPTRQVVEKHFHANLQSSSPAVFDNGYPKYGLSDSI